MMPFRVSSWLVLNTGMVILRFVVKRCFPNQSWKTEYSNEISPMHICVCERCSPYCAYTFQSYINSDGSLISSRLIQSQRRGCDHPCIYHLSRVFIWIECAEAVHALLCPIFWLEASVLALGLTASHFAQSGERWRIECLRVWLLSIIDIIIVLITHSCLFLFSLVSFTMCDAYHLIWQWQLKTRNQIDLKFYLKRKKNRRLLVKQLILAYSCFWYA